MKNINSDSPIFRDSLLNKNIGKYNYISESLIQPIGTSFDIDNSIKKDSIIPNGLLDYINRNNFSNKKGELEKNLVIPYFENRNKESIDIEYDNIIEQYSYLESKTYNDVKGDFINPYDYKIKKSENIVDLGYNSIKLKQYSSLEKETYHDPKDKNWVSMGIESTIGYILGDSIALSSTNNGIELVSSSLDTAINLPSRLIEYGIGKHSNLEKIGFNSLGISMANSVLQKTRINDSTNNFFEKSIGFYDSIDVLDFDKMNITIPNGLSNFTQKTLPIYFYTEVKKSNIGDFTWINKGEITNYISGEKKTIKVDDSVVYEDNLPESIKSFSLAPQSLLAKTQKLFNNGKIQTIISQLGVEKIDGDSNIKSFNPLSRGRALKDVKNKDFCRVWTASNQYNKISSLIRPFSELKKDILKHDLKKVRPNNESTASLSKYGVLQDDGFVKIAPYKNNKFSKDDIKKYMFSIENLAWKDSIDSLIENTSQDGPNGGRIMWFPPYDISFNETTSVNWNTDVFIGRGEPVYTYTNTERNGTISFKIIVDHPSIINYYKQSNDLSNQSLLKDDDYLRFFAGEEVIYIPDEAEKYNETPNEKIKQTETSTREIIFKIYFPSNYSGISDGYKNAIKYLYEGHACSINKIEEKPSGYEMETGYGNGLSDINSIQGCYFTSESEIDGVPAYFYRADIYQNVVVSQRKDTFSYGLNSIKQDTTNKNLYTFKEAYEYIEGSNTSGEELKNKIEARYNYINSYIDKSNAEIMMDLKYVDNEISGTSETNNQLNAAQADYNAKMLVFEEAEAEDKQINTSGFENTIELSNITQDTEIPDSTTDVLTGKLKNKFYEYLKKLKELKEKLKFYNNTRLDYFNGGRSTINDILITFDIYESVKNEYNNNEVPALIEELGLYYIEKSNLSGSTKNDFLQTLLDASEIIVTSSVSKSGYESTNEKLINDRNNIVCSWLSNYNPKSEIYKTKTYISDSDLDLNGDINSKNAKLDRYVEVKIITKPTIEDIKNIKNETLKDKTDTTNNNESYNQIKRIKKSFFNYKYDKNGLNLSNDESQFFEKIGNSEDSKIIFEKLSEKIKYFTPAFHSVTPEGFNSRLTFLHQCTRQGPTLEASSSNTNQSANNMSFGRPPICVLRIGDFYNTKIAIDSLNIDFDPLVWDLNEEGIGVQPMIANVNLNFKFIGGSDLTGPIARLQNAITFNFFANTGVYDDRNDRITKHEYDSNNKLSDTYDTLYNPGIYDKKK